ncbi:MAG: NAD(P)H-quinone oxidoreductase, partial [Methylococcaceae bacterium]|nr:NAD(P)H-quinone oxidoreductase [Methylococcaceae bacterium]
MRAIEIEANALKLTERPIPTPEDHQVLIKTAAAGVNRPDIM